MLKLDCFACAFMKQSLIVAGMNKELIRGGLKALVLFVLIYAIVWLRIKVVCFLIMWLILKTLDSLFSSNFHLNLVAFFFLVPWEKKIVLEVSSTITPINHVTWPTRNPHVLHFETWPMSQIPRDLHLPNVSYFLKKRKLRDVYQTFTIELF